MIAMASYPSPNNLSSTTSHQQHNSSQFRISRKPLPTGSTNLSTSNDHDQPPRYSEHNPETLKSSVPAALRPELSLETSLSTSITDSQLYTSPEHTQQNSGNVYTPITHSSASTITSFPSANNSSILTPNSSTSSKSTSTYIKKAYQEARHFAGGLVSHPYESTKHFTILRHSHGLVFYQGSRTSLAISIFSDEPLPSDRTLWLQNKGWSGKTGMRAKAFIGRNGNWLNITPTVAVGTEQLNPNDERAWQRDLAKFRKKAPAKIRNKHLVRETAVVRIPAEAGDGYFQIVMCAGDNKKKIYCTSPVFRLLSTSTSPSSLRGASLSTLPLELGAMVLSTYASNTVGSLISPVTSAVQSSVERYMPSFWTQEAAATAYGMSGLEDRVSSTIENANNQYDHNRERSLATVGNVELDLNEGPKTPYPMQILGRTQLGLVNMVEELDMPVFSLTGVNEGTLQKLHGYYFGLARNIEKPGDDETAWCQAVISVVPINIIHLSRVNIAQANKRMLSVRLICGFEDMPIDQTLFEIRVLGFIRPDEPGQRINLEKAIQAGDEAAHEAALLSEVNDIRVAQSFLDHPAWAPDTAVRPRIQQRKSSGLQKISEGYANTRLAAQRQMDRVPLHKIGIRLEADKLKDEAIVINGFYVPR